MTADERVDRARAYLAEVDQIPADHLPPSQLVRQCAELRVTWLP
jgi:hypothetical protein